MKVQQYIETFESRNEATQMYIALRTQSACVGGRLYRVGDKWRVQLFFELGSLVDGRDCVLPTNRTGNPYGLKPATYVAIHQQGGEAYCSRVRYPHRRLHPEEWRARQQTHPKAIAAREAREMLAARRAAAAIAAAVQPTLFDLVG